MTRFLQPSLGAALGFFLLVPSSGQQTKVSSQPQASPAQASPQQLPVQTPAAQHSDDNGNSPLINERLQIREEAKREKKIRGDKDADVEQDDPRARAEWQRLTYGVPSVEYTRKQMRTRRENKNKIPRDRSGISRDAESADMSTAFPATLTSSGPTWISVGPGDEEYAQNGGYYTLETDSGRARKILLHPTDPDTLYFLTSGGGLWVTHNFSAHPPSWTPLTDNLATTGGGAVAFGRTPNVLYLGMGDPFDVINVGGSMMKSIDGGQTWTNFVELGLAQSVRDIQVDTSGPEDIVLVSTDTGMFRSVDSGINYSQVAGGPGEIFEAKEFWHMVKSSAGYLVNARPCTLMPAASACTSISSTYVSTDTGATWSLIPNSGNVFANAGRVTLSVASPGDAVVYALAANGAGTAQIDLFRSIDGGLNWTALGVNSTKVPLNPNSNNPNMDIMHAQGWYNQMVLVDPRDVTRNIVYIAGNLSSAKSIDGGNTWTLLTDWAYGFNGPPYAHADFHTAAFSSTGTPTLLFGNDGGLFISTDDGTSWSGEKNKGLETFLLYSIIGTPKYPGTFIVGAQDNGTRIRKGQSKIFNQSIGGDGAGVGWGQGIGYGAALGTVDGSIYRRNVTGQKPEFIETWEPASPNYGETVFFTPVATPTVEADPTSLTFFTNFSTRVVKTTDAGFFYNTIGRAGFGGIPSTRTFRSQAHSVGVGPFDQLHIGVAGANGNIDLTSDGGTTWLDRSLNSLVPGFNSSISTVTWADNSVVYAASEAPTLNAVRIVKSLDGGNSWARSDTGLPDGRVARIVVDPRDATHSTLYAGGDLGIFRSTDAGANWSSYGQGLPNVRVNDIYMPPDGSFLAIATYGRGVWILPSLTYASSSLNDDGLSCDHDGSLDSNETGHLSITLHNGGLGTLNNISATITSTNPNITFPSGQSMVFASVAGGADVTATLAVGMTSIAGIQQADFTIAYTEPALQITSPVTALASFRVNTDQRLSGSSNDDFEASSTAWSFDGTAQSLPNVFNWERRQITPLEHRWAVIGSNARADEYFISPALQVGQSNFSFDFEKRHVLNFTAANPSAVPPTAARYFDGMALEISTNGGSSWNDIGQFASPPYDGPIDAAVPENVLVGRPVYGGRSANYPAFGAVNVNLGTQYAGQSVRIRFRMASADFGQSTGVEIRNFTTSGLVNTPFVALTAHSAACSTSNSIQSSHNPSEAGENVTFTANISGGITAPTGNMEFRNGGAVVRTVTLDGAGQAQFSTVALSAGSHNITAQFVGDAGHAASTSSVLVQNVNLASTTTTLLSSANPSIFGDSVIFTVNIAGGLNTPTGNVIFKDGGNELGTVALNGSGQSQFNTTSLTVGPHNITAEYAGDGQHAVSASSVLVQTVTKASTTTTLISGTNPSVFGNSVTFTANVSGGVNIATGYVAFKDGVNTLATIPLNGSAQSQFTTSVLTVGAHSIVGEYSGDGQHATSSSSLLTQTVNPASTNATLGSGNNPSIFGASVTFTISIVGGVDTPTGNVIFKDGTGVLGTVALNVNGQSQFTTTSLAVGSHNIAAQYSGDQEHNGSNSSVLVQTVNPASTTSTLISGTNPSVFGAAVTFTSSVSGGVNTPTGDVIIKDGTNVLGAVALNSVAQSQFTTSALVIGSHSITAEYAGDVEHGASTSIIVVQTVIAASTTTTLISGTNPSAVGNSVTFTAGVSGGVHTPTGNVVFKDGSAVLGTIALNNAGQSQISTTSLTVGTHTITAEYAGDAEHVASASSNVVQTVNPAGTTTALSSGTNPSIYGLGVTFTASVAGGVNTPTGAVTFKDNGSVIGTSTLNVSGQAPSSTVVLTVGAHNITAEYGGDGQHAASTSAILVQNVQKVSTSTALSSGANPGFAGGAVVFTATVSGSPVATGNISFRDGSVSIGNVSLNASGIATLATSALSVATHAITAEYIGDIHHEASTSTVLNEQISVAADTQPALLQFGSYVVGRQKVLTYTLQNHTPAPLTVIPSATGAFSPVGGCTSAIPASGSCDGQVSFAPTGVGAGNGSMNFSSSAGYYIPSINLVGSGVDFVLTLSRPKRTSRSGTGSIAARETATFELQISAIGDLNLTTVQVTCSDVPAILTCRSSHSASTGMGVQAQVEVTNLTPVRTSRLRRRVAVNTLQLAVPVIVTVQGAQRKIEIPISLER